MSDLSAPVSESRELAPGFAVAQAVLKPRKARPFYGRHPWVLDSAIARIEGQPADGDVVDLLTDKGKFIARGIFNSRSRIRVRLYTWDNARGTRRVRSGGRGWKRPSPAHATRLERRRRGRPAGLQRRRRAERPDRRSLRQLLAVQVTALAMAVRLARSCQCWSKLTAPRGHSSAPKGRGRAPKGSSCATGCTGAKPDGPVLIVENGLRYGVDLAEGQKTGFYLDQRENRRAAARYFRGRRVLDMFCYSGGFSLTAADSRRGPRSAGRRHERQSRRAGLGQCRAERPDERAVRERRRLSRPWHALAGQGRRFGGVVLDPPKFARSRGALDEALRAYHWLNRLAVDVLEPGGILVTCSCSGHVTREDFLHMLVGVAQQTGREIQVLEQRGAAADHPVAVTCLESEYLKCFICRVA